jgi:hypothetical protein
VPRWPGFWLERRPNLGADLDLREGRHNLAGTKTDTAKCRNAIRVPSPTMHLLRFLQFAPE